MVGCSCNMTTEERDHVQASFARGRAMERRLATIYNFTFIDTCAALRAMLPAEGTQGGGGGDDGGGGDGGGGDRSLSNGFDSGIEGDGDGDGDGDAGHARLFSGLSHLCLGLCRELGTDHTIQDAGVLPAGIRLPQLAAGVYCTEAAGYGSHALSPVPAQT
jgi:hypothetical protein